MPASSHRAPPLVRVTVSGVRLYAYLLAWVGAGAARVGWVEQYHGAPYQWRWVEADVPRGDVETLEGQAYTAVPTGAGEVRAPGLADDDRTWREQKRG